jgi:hypothetical protein
MCTVPIDGKVAPGRQIAKFVKFTQSFPINSRQKSEQALRDQDHITEALNHKLPPFKMLLRVLARPQRSLAMPSWCLGSPCSTSGIAWLATRVLCRSEADRALPTRIAVRATRDDLPAIAAPSR